MTVITDENDIVKEICLIPGNGRLPQGWHCYFPIKEELPNVGQKFLPNLETQPWLAD